MMDMPNEPGWLAAGIAAALSWFGRGFTSGAKWGTVEARLGSIEKAVERLDARFESHLAEDRVASARLEDRLDRINNSVGQLIGKQG